MPISISPEWGTIKDAANRKKADLTANLYADHVRQLADSAPPLSAAQRDTITAAFAGFTAGGEIGDRH